MGETQAVYAGSFDPLTYGHMNIIERSLRIFDKIIVAVAINYQKQAAPQVLLLKGDEGA